MRGFDVTVHTGLAPQDAWDAVTHWPAHGGHVPLTTVHVTREAGGPGDEFVGRTGVGRVGFDDPMRVTRWQPPTAEAPGICEITKLGRVVTGGATIEVRASGDGSAVRWMEQVEIGPAWLTRLGGPVISRGGAVAFARVLRRLFADAERERARRRG